MSNYYVSGCVTYGDDVSICDDNVAQFWTLYHRNEEGLSEGIIDCTFREDAETAMRAYEERDTLAAENVALKNFAWSEVVAADQEKEDRWMTECTGARDRFISMQTPTTNAFLNSIRAEGVDKAIAHLHKKFEGTGHIGVPVMALESLANQLRSGEPS